MLCESTYAKVLYLASGNSIPGFYCQIEKVTHFLGGLEKLPHFIVYDNVLYNLYRFIASTTRESL